MNAYVESTRSWLVCLVLLVLPIAASGEISNWTISGAVDSGDPLYTASAAPNARAGPLAHSPAMVGELRIDEFSSESWPDFPSVLDRYIELTVAPEPGWELDLTALEFSIRADQPLSGAQAGWEIRSSLDCYASALDSGMVAPDALGKFVSADLTSLGNSEDAVTFRIHLRWTGPSFCGTSLPPCSLGLLGSAGGGQDPRVSGAVVLDTTPIDFVRMVPTHMCLPDSVAMETGVAAGSLWASVERVAPVDGIQFAGHLYRSDDGLFWELVTEGFGSTGQYFVSPPVDFAGDLYSGTKGDGKIYRSQDGGDTWQEVWDSPVLCVRLPCVPVLPEVEFAGHLYARHLNELIRSSDGTTWTSVSSGFGDANNRDITDAHVFDGALYVSTENRTTGVEIWRTIDGTTFVQVNTDGFGDPSNESATLVAVGLWLYAGTYWNPVTFEGGELWRSKDGVAWVKVVDDGFGPVRNTAINLRSGPFEGLIWAGTTHLLNAPEIWWSEDGATWTQSPAPVALGEGRLFADARYQSRLYLTSLDSIYASAEESTPVPVPLLLPLPLAVSVLLFSLIGAAALRR